MTSVHVVRKAGFNDTAFNHQFHDLINDVSSEHSEDDEVPETKNQNFEFSNSYSIMRIIRMILVIQVLGLIIDDPTIEISKLFNIFCRGILYYSIRFFSRPFVDIIYLIQYFWQQIYMLANSNSNLPATPGNIELDGLGGSGRRLNNNPFGNSPNPMATTLSIEMNFVNARNWHAIIHFSHYFLAIFFTIFSILFAMRFWEITDYSNREEIKRWLHNYISDGWWRRGGFFVAKYTSQGVFCLAILILAMSSISRGFSVDSITNGITLTSLVAIGFTIICVIWFLGYIGIKFTESAFLRYVSQNVAYTSAIILKRAVKAKFDLGLILMISMYIPTLYILLQSILMFTDWNDTLVTPMRKNYNYYIACYYMAFPPYREQRLPNEYCPVLDYMSDDQKERKNGLYFDDGILQCDSYLGISFYIVGVTFLSYLILGYFYMFHSLISQVEQEFKLSKCVEVLNKLIQIEENEKYDYCERFSIFSRIGIKSYREFFYQIKSIRVSIFFVFTTIYEIIVSLIDSMWYTVVTIATPIWFFIERLLILSCLNVAVANFQIVKNSISSSIKVKSREGENEGKGESRLNERMKSKSFRESFSLSRRKNKSSRSINNRTNASNRINFDAEFNKSNRFNLQNTSENEFWSLSNKVQYEFNALAEKYNIFGWVFDSFTDFKHNLNRSIAKLHFVAYFQVRYNMFLQRIVGIKNEDGSLEHGAASLGVPHAPWRTELNLKNKTDLLCKMKQHTINELRSAKFHFISEHELLISFLDRTLDSSGMFTLLALYDYPRMYWFLIVLLEMTLYGILSASIKQYANWIVRNIIILFINLLFGIITYASTPFTEELDRWLEFSGRVLISLICVGLIVCKYTNEGDNLSNGQTPMFTPWSNFSIAFHDISNINLSVIIDIIMVFYFYFYILYILYLIGTFRMISRMIKAFIFSYHDHILDFLIEKLDERNFGLENIYSGLKFIQQWDDIIKLQRRYALLSWPDVRPSNLITFHQKLFEIKWASFFNLTLKNLKSSLGLTILHISTFQGDSELSRWIIYSNPELLTMKDSQNDTPITIALKECAYYLLLYNEQNDYKLDDQTSYDDDDYSNYYPEIDDIRDEIYNNGEFIVEQCIVYNLTADDLNTISQKGYYPIPNVLRNTSKEVNESEAIATNSRSFSSPPKNLSSISTKSTKAVSAKAKSIALNYIEEQKLLKQNKQKERLRTIKNKAEKEALVMKRFPEDSLYDNFEAGQNSSWSILNFKISNEQIYKDKYLIQRMKKFPNYHYYNKNDLSDLKAELQLLKEKIQFHENGENKHDGNNNDSKSEEDESGKFADLERNEKIDLKLVNQKEKAYRHLEGEDTTHFNHSYAKLLVKNKNERDLQYVINPTFHKVNILSDQRMMVPLDHEALEEIHDWDMASNTTSLLESGLIGLVRPFSAASEKNSDKLSDKQSELGSQRLSRKAASAKAYTSMGHNYLQEERVARYKICKFAEILMSDEINEISKGFKWNIDDFKAFNKLASVNQGKIAQQLSLVCHLNPPPGFVRVSDWSVGNDLEMFDEKPEEELNIVVKSIVTVVSTIENAAVGAINTVENFKDTFNKTMNNFTQSKGRNRRRRRTTSRSYTSRSSRRNSGKGSKISEDGQERDTYENGMLSDRVIHYLAEALVCSSQNLELDDSELSYNGRRGWRAIARALRKKYASFIIPSVFVPQKPIILTTLVLSKNELDCGDCVLLTDIFSNQLNLEFVDLSFNRIGSRGMNRICKALSKLDKLTNFQIHHNIIGPGAGKDIGIFLKLIKNLKIFNISFNHLGEIMRFPTLYSMERIPTAAHDICLGLKYNRTIEIFDMSYNHLGPDLADYLPMAINKHPYLHSLNISGNDLGSVKGSNLLFALAGMPNGAKYAKEKEEFIQVIRHRQKERLLKQQEEKFKNSLIGEEKNSYNDIEDEVLKDMFLNEDKTNEEERIKSSQNDHSNFMSIYQQAMGQNSLYNEQSVFSDTNNNHNIFDHEGALVLPNKNDSIYSESKVNPQFNQSIVSLSSPKKPLVYQPRAGNTRAERSLHDMMNSLSQSYEDSIASKITKPALNLTSLSIADNQLGAFSGHAIAAILERTKGLTHLDLSGNALGPLGGELICDSLELLYFIKPREFLKLILYEIEEGKYIKSKFNRNPKKKKKVFTNLLNFNLSRNSLGPKIISSFGYCLASSKCTLISLDLSDNPFGLSNLEIAGNAAEAALDIRQGFMDSLSLIDCKLKNTLFVPTDLVTIFGGMSHHENLMKINLDQVVFDEPACLQFGNVISHCPTLKSISLNGCKLGANGGIIIAQKLVPLAHRLKYLDISWNHMGPIAGIYVGELLKSANCALNTLRAAGNDFMEEGGGHIAKALLGNDVLTDLDLSENLFTELVAVFLSDSIRGLFKNGVKVKDNFIKRLVLNNNPMIGYKGSKILMRTIANEKIEHLEIANITAGPGTGNLISLALRNPKVAWKYLNISNNHLNRFSLNAIFWGIRSNKRLRSIDVTKNRGGTLFLTNDDSLLSHGISVPVMLKSNVVLRELNLSYNSLVSEAGLNILDAVIDNHTLKKLCLRGNLLDDNIAILLPDLLRCNNVLEELDLGYNQMGFSCSFAISESLEFNRSLKKLYLDYNQLGSAGSATLQPFIKSMTMNYSLEYLNMDGNKLGPEWGQKFSEIIIRNNTITQLSLRDNHFDSRAGTLLLNSYRHNKYLIELALTSDEIGAETWEEFRTVFLEKRASVNPSLIETDTILTETSNTLVSNYRII